MVTRTSGVGTAANGHQHDSKATEAASHSLWFSTARVTTHNSPHQGSTQPYRCTVRSRGSTRGSRPPLTSTSDHTSIECPVKCSRTWGLACSDCSAQRPHPTSLSVSGPLLTSPHHHDRRPTPHLIVVPTENAMVNSGTPASLADGGTLIFTVSGGLNTVSVGGENIGASSWGSTGGGARTNGDDSTAIDASVRICGDDTIGSPATQRASGSSMSTARDSWDNSNRAGGTGRALGASHRGHHCASAILQLGMYRRS